MNFLIKFFATGFGVGYLPKMPGTYGSMVGVGLWALIYRYVGAWHAMPLQIIAVIAFCLVSIWISARAEKIFGEHDSPKIVIDEIAGIFITFLAVPLSWTTAVLGFVLFRFFDIVKPPPIRQSQRLPGGWGVVVDDLLAGAAANIVLQVVVKVL